MSKRSKIVTIACSVAILLFFGLGFGQVFRLNEAAALASDGPAAGTLEVIGTGAVKVKPDIAVLNIGVTTNGATTAVQETNTKTMDNVLARVKALGIDEKDIRTVSYYLNPEYDYSYDKGAAKIVGYTVYNMIEVKVRNIDKAGEVLAAAVEAGANVNSGISFTLSNADAYYSEALAKAVANAKSKAGTLAKAAGVSIGLPSRITENYSYYSPMYGNYNSMDIRAEAAAGAVTVAQGEIEVTASVSVSYTY